MNASDIMWFAPLVFLLAGTIKGAIGIGLPTTIIALLSIIVDPRLAVALGLFSMIVSNIWQVHREGDWLKTLRRFWPLSVVTGVVLIGAAQFAADAPQETILMATGVAVALFSASSLIGSPPALPKRFELPGQIVVGVASGVMGGVAGIWSPPVLVFLLALRLEKTEFVRTVGLLLLLGAVPLLIGYVNAGLMSGRTFLYSIALAIPVFIGFAIGERVRRRMDAARFQKALLVFFLIMGLNMVRQALV